MRKFTEVKFDYIQCASELKDFKALLDNNTELDERKNILPFFKEHKNLCALLGSYLGGVIAADLIANELSIFGDFACDLAVGDSKTGNYLLIEFENATEKSIFYKNAKKDTLEWSPRFEHGYSQIVDWFWKIDEMRRTPSFEDVFETKACQFKGMLIIGRDESLHRSKQFHRFHWRRSKAVIDSQHIMCFTFDEVYSLLQDRYDIYKNEIEKIVVKR